MKNEQTQVAVRAMPAGGHQYRWCAQRPWSKDAKTVIVKDAAARIKAERDKDTGKVHHTYPDEITFEELAELEADPHIVVRRVGEADVDADELNALKAKTAKQDEALRKARGQLQQHAEELSEHKAYAAKQAEEQGAIVAKLQQENQALQAELKKALKKAAEKPE